MAEFLTHGGLTARRKLWVDVFGYVVFFFPVCFIMLEMAWPWAWTSFQEGEMSANAGGLPVWPVKFLLPFGFTLLALVAASGAVAFAVATPPGKSALAVFRICGPRAGAALEATGKAPALPSRTLPNGQLAVQVRAEAIEPQRLGRAAALPKPAAPR